MEIRKNHDLSLKIAKKFREKSIYQPQILYISGFYGLYFILNIYFIINLSEFTSKISAINTISFLLLSLIYVIINRGKNVLLENVLFVMVSTASLINLILFLNNGMINSICVLLLSLFIIFLFEKMLTFNFYKGRKYRMKQLLLSVLIICCIYSYIFFINNWWIILYAVILELFISAGIFETLLFNKYGRNYFIDKKIQQGYSIWSKSALFYGSVFIIIVLLLIFLLIIVSSFTT